MLQPTFRCRVRWTGKPGSDAHARPEAALAWPPILFAYFSVFMYFAGSFWKSAMQSEQQNPMVLPS